MLIGCDLEYPSILLDPTVHFSLHFHWPGGAGRSTENGDRRSDSAMTPMAMHKLITNSGITQN